MAFRTYGEVMAAKSTVFAQRLLDVAFGAEDAGRVKLKQSSEVLELALVIMQTDAITVKQLKAPGLWGALAVFMEYGVSFTWSPTACDLCNS